MKIKITVILIILILVTAVYAADRKWSVFPANTTVADADEMLLIDIGTGDSERITVLNLFDTIDTSAELIAILTNETGTGALVFAISPTLVTPALGVIASGVGTTLTALNGENIQDDTIDDDSIDWADCTFADFDFETAWKMWHSDAAGDVTEITLGANGTFLESNGAAANPAFRALVDGDVPDNITIDLATLATTVTVSDDEATNDNQEIVFTTDNVNLESDGDLHYNPSTGTITATEFVGGGAGLTAIDGENITDDTIDNDSIDWGDMTDLTTDGALDADVVDEAHIADNGIDSEHYNNGSIDLVHLDVAVYAVDLVTTAPVTGATDNIMVGADADVTIALDFTAAWNFGAAAGSEWVNDGNPTTDAAGELALDTTIVDHQPLWQYYDGGENMTIIAIDTAQLPALDNEIVKYDAGTDKFVLEADAGGNDVYVEEGDAARVDSSGADLYIDFDDTDFGVGVVGNEGNITITDDGHAHTGASVTGIGDAQVDNNITIDLATLATTVTVTDDEATADNQEIVFTTDNANLESDGDFHYNPSTGTVTATQFVGGGLGGFTAYDDITDPDAAGSISFDDTETATYTTVQDTAGSFISFINSNADVSNQVYMLDLDYSADTTQDNADFIRLQDAGSTLVVFEEEGKITMTPSGVDDAIIISIVPSVALTQADAFWCGVQIDGDALDPGDVDNVVLGVDIDLSGVDLTNVPYVEALELTMPTGGVALHIEEGKIKQEFTSGSDAGAEYTAIDMFMDASSQAANSETHAIDVAVIGGDPAGLVVGIGTHTYVAPVHQHIGVFSTPDQVGADSEAGFFDDSGTDYIDGVDGIEQFTADDDAIWISAAAVFTEIEVIMGTPATRSITPTFWYWKDLGVDAWTQFFPADDTDGFQQSGLIRWEIAAVPDWLSADVVNISAGDAGEAAAGYWIAIIRTVNADPGTPTPTTVKTGVITDFFWDETGGIDVLSMEADTITEGGNAVPNATDHLGFFGGTTSAELYGELSDETGAAAGTPLAVFNTAPVFVTSIQLTGADANPAAAAGTIAYDSTIAVLSGGGLRWYDDNSVRLIVDLETDPTDDDYVVTYDAAADGFYMSVAGTGNMNTATYDAGVSGGVDQITTVDSTYASDYVLLTATAVGTDAPKTDGALTYDAATGTLSATEFAGSGANLTAIDAVTGDSATAFFDAGTIEHEWGGLQANLAAYTGLIGITGADTTVEVDTSAEMATAITDETGSGKLTFATAPVFVTSIQLTGADANPAAAAGTIAYDSTIGVMAGGGLRWYDDNSVRLIVDLETDPSNDDYVVTYDAAADGFYMLDSSGFGAAMAWDDIADPDAAATIDFTTFTQTIDIGKSDSGGGDGLVLDVTGLGAGADDVIALKITTATDGDNDFVPIAIYDNTNDLKFFIDYAGGLNFKLGAIIYQATNEYIEFAENNDVFKMFFGGTDVDLIWSDGALNLRNNENGVDAIVNIQGKDNGEKGILRVMSDGDDKYIELYHNDTNARISSNSGSIDLSPESLIMPKRTSNDDRFYTFNLFNPNSLYDTDTQVCFEPNLPANITITEVTVTCDADPATELDIDLKWADAFIGLGNATLIEPIDTTNGTTDIDAGFDDATVAAGKCLYVEFGADPISAIKQAIVKVRYDFD